MTIDYLKSHQQFLDQLAALQFELWGPLTGSEDLEGYKEFLQGGINTDGLPATLLALERERVLGSVNLVANDLPVRKDLTPWLGQLYVYPEARGRGIGSELVRAVEKEARRRNWRKLYLYTSGTLPNFYEKLGWHGNEEVEYLDEKRVVMEIDLNR